MQIIKFKITGASPLVVHADTLCNPLNPLTKEIKSFTGKRKKTDDDLAMIAKLEWKAGLHYDKELGPIIPGQNIDACFIGAAKLQKRGPDVKRGLMTIENKIPLLYDGPRNIDKLFGNGDNQFVDIRSVVIQRARCMRCRPIFNEWGLEFSVGFNPEIFNQDDVVTLLKTAGGLIGLCDMRPRYGKFDVKVVK